MVNVARMFIGLGAALLCIGLLLALLNRFNVPIGRLPGDITWRGRNTTVYFPWVTCLVVSVLITAVMWLFNRQR